jgi:hypothetical protein
MNNGTCSIRAALRELSQIKIRSDPAATPAVIQSRSRRVIELLAGINTHLDVQSLARIDELELIDDVREQLLAALALTRASPDSLGSLEWDAFVFAMDDSIAAEGFLLRELYDDIGDEFTDMSEEWIPSLSEESTRKP